MNILIIGNGFDIAHNLPTTYKDFIHFMNVIERFRNNTTMVDEFVNQKDDIYENEQLKPGVKKYFDNIFSSFINYSSQPIDNDSVVYLKKMLDLSEDNLWFKYFRKKIKEEGNYWTGFESDISDIVQEFEKIKNITVLGEFSDSIKDFLGLNSNDVSSFDHTRYKQLKEKTINDLNNLIMCLEIYLEDCINKLEIELFAPFLYETKIDKVLSFNYTTTFERCFVYRSNFSEICYIHGKANLDVDENNMVLGIDEYLSDSEKNINIEFVEFKKYFQRIHKKTGCEYKKWIEEIENQEIDGQSNLYIWGHSLAITDKDILKEFLLCNNISVTVFYHNKNQYKRQIANLVTVLGQDEMISKVYGLDPKIVFLEQGEMYNINDLTSSIDEDIFILKNFHIFGIDVFKRIIDRVIKNFKTINVQYFENEEKVQMLYDCLLPEQRKEFYWFYWDIIKAINANNKINTNKLNSTNLTALSAQLDKEMDMPTRVFNSLFEELFEKIKLDGSNTQIIWECFYKLSMKVKKAYWNEYIDDKYDKLSKDDYAKKYYLEYLKSEQLIAPKSPNLV